jgi:4-hydroxybenzoyl-CoA reductase alpha subunit
MSREKKSTKGSGSDRGRRGGAPARYKVVGVDNRRVDASDKSGGRAGYTDDFTLPGMLFARLKRATVAHGWIDSISVDKALALEGVRAVITGKDLPVKYGILPVTQDETALAVEKVRHVGEPVAAVCADTEAIADKALDLIDVVYSPLHVSLSAEDAFKSPERIHEAKNFEGNAHRVIALEFGNVAQAFEDTDYAREDTFYFAGSTHVPMETHSTLADWDGSRMTVYVSHQAPYYVQKLLPKVLEIPPQSLRVVVPYVGGGFGGKLDLFSDNVCAAKLSMITGRPVKLTLSREEVFYNHRGRHPSSMWIKTAVKDGKIAAMQFKAYLDGGAYGSFGTAASYYHGAVQPVTYKFPAYKYDIVRFYTNKPPCGPKRGHGTPQPRFALECHLDKIAEDLGTDPIRLRLDNLMTPYSTTVNHMRVTSCGLKECIERVVEGSGYHDKRGKLPYGQGIGFAVGAYLCGAAVPIWWNQMPQTSVIVKADRSGKISAYSGHTEIGQGADTVLSYVVAERLGLKPADVALVLRDTDSVPPDLGSYSSRVTWMMGNAALDAVNKLRRALAEAAGRILDEDASQLVFADGMIRTAGGKREVPIADAVVEAESEVGSLSFGGDFKSDVQYGDFKGSGVGPSPAYSYAACAIQVDLDPVTGIAKPSDVWIAHDIGRCINRKNVEGQIEGGVYMGLGEAMMEEMEFTKTGLLKNAGLLDYKTPTVNETPDIHIYLVEDEDENGPFGAKEVGQGPLLPVIPAFANAVYDAIGVRFDETPITPDKVIKALESKATRVGPRRLFDFPFPDPIRVEVPEDAAP